MSTAPGKLLERLTRYKYVKALAFWVDVTSEGKVLSKLFQRNNLLISDVTSGVENSVSAVVNLKDTPGTLMTALVNDFDTDNETLYGTELSDIATGEVEYKLMLGNVTTSIGEHLTARYFTILKHPVLKAACIFEHWRWPSFSSARQQLEAYGEDEITLLLAHYKTLYGYLGGDQSKVQREWRRLKLLVARTETLVRLSYVELYHRLFDHHSNKYMVDSKGVPTEPKRLDDQSLYNILLLIAIVFTYAVDTSICERGFALMNNLKTARRSQMGNLLLRTLMTICTLGAEWKDPTKIPVDEIVEEWRSQSTRGRYEAAMWQAAGLEEPRPKIVGPGNAGGSDGVEVAGADPGDFQYDWDKRNQARARAFPPPQAATPMPAPAARPANVDESDDDE